ncbi:type II secretion system minor pseudopilin GspH [Marinobacteraceae bacterium S3BR75-40.1]
MRHQRGFTLIEILVVVIIVGLMATIAVLNVGDAPERHKLEEKVRKLYLTLQTASDEAVLDSREIGLKLDKGEVRFLVYQPPEVSVQGQDSPAGGTWEPMQNDPFRGWTVPDWLKMEIEPAADQPRLPVQGDKEKLPDLVLFSSGETTPFQIRLWLARGDQDQYMHKLVSDGLNGIEWIKPHDDES